MIKASPKAYMERTTKLILNAGTEHISEVPSQMLWGQPGIGKSASLFELATAVERGFKDLHKKIKVKVTDIRLVLFNPVDLRGIPTADESKTAAIWLKPQIFDLKEKVWVNPVTEEEVTPQTEAFKFELKEDPTTGKMVVVKHIPPINSSMKVVSEVIKGDKIHITIVPANAEEWEVINFFFMDELSAAAPSVQACAYQITHDKQLGEHKLPKNTIVFCAGNRVTDKSVAFAMPMALANRVTHTEYTLDHDGWREWALGSGVDQRIIAFLGFQKQYLNKFVDKDGRVTTDQVFPTPRSWENSSKYLKFLDLNDAYPFLAGTVGEGVATEFRTYCNVYGRLPKIEDILEGKPVQHFTEPDISWAIVTTLFIEATNLGNLKDKADATRKLQNIIKYILGMKQEFAILAGKDLLTIRSILPLLLRLPEWNEWKTKFRNYIV